jgi:hypothetical protein
VGDVDLLSAQLTMLDEDRARVCEPRAAGFATATAYTWSKAGVRLLNAYTEVISQRFDVVALAA